MDTSLGFSDKKFQQIPLRQVRDGGVVANHMVVLPSGRCMWFRKSVHQCNRQLIHLQKIQLHERSKAICTLRVSEYEGLG